MSQSDVQFPPRTCKALRFLAIAATLVLLPPLLALLLIPLLLFAAPAALIGIPFMIPGLLPGVLSARSDERQRILRAQRSGPLVRVQALLEPMPIEIGKEG